MDKPKCRVCEHKHWSSEPHVFTEERGKPKTVGERPTKAVGGRRPDKQVRVVTAPRTSATQRVYEWRKQNKERYNAYQKEFMRSKRNAEQNT